MKIVDLSLKIRDEGSEVIGTKCESITNISPMISDMEAIVFDVSHVKDRLITENDFDLSQVEEGLFVVFYTGYNGKANLQPELSMTLICELIDRGIQGIGIDFPSLRKNFYKSYIKNLIFESDMLVVENLDNLDKILEVSNRFVASVYAENRGTVENTCRIIGRAS